MDHSDNRKTGTLAGLLLASAATWARYDDDTQRRLRNVKDDTEEALDLIREYQSRGEVIRGRLPIVNDAQVGLALANPAPIAPSVVPSVSKLSRPEMTSDAALNLSWPPKVGQYDGKGNVGELGEMTSLFLALTFEEVRAFLLGLTQAKAPNADGKIQINLAAHELVEVVASLKLTEEQYRTAWLRLFTGVLPSQPGSGDAHRDASKPPTVASFDAGISLVQPLGKPDIGNHPYEHRNTDACMKFRITVPAGPGVASGVVAMKVNFGTEYRTPDNKPVQPTVLVNDYRFSTDGVTSTGFDLVTVTALSAGSYDVFIATQGC